MSRNRPIIYGDPVAWDHPLNRGLVSWWLPLPGRGAGFTLHDIAGKNHGTLTNGPTWAAGLGAGGSVRYVGSSSQYTSVPPQFNGASGGFSVFGRTYLADTSTGGAFLKIGNITHPSGGDGVGIGTGTGIFETAGNRLLVLFEGLRWIDTGVDFGVGWHNWGIVIDGGGKPRVYLDGYPVYSDVGTSMAYIGSLGTPITQIGGYLSSASANRYMTGLVEEVRCYDRIVTDTEAAGISDQARRGHPDTLRRLTNRVYGFGVAAVYDGSLFPRAECFQPDRSPWGVVSY